MKNICENMQALLPSLRPLVAPEGMSKEKQEELFYKMCAIRAFDVRVKELWMASEIYGLAHAYTGAEAIAIGAMEAIEKTDYITSTHRGHGHTYAKGADAKSMMAELFGKYEGLNRGKGGSMHIADVDIGMMGATGIVGSGMPLAVGAGLSSRVLKNNTVAICFHGDGGTNQGVWHESINMAAAWDLPVIFLIENNQYAIATKCEWVTKEQDLYKRAIGYGIEGVQIDGFNVFEVYKAVKKAVDKARSGGGPTLIEARFIRILGHFVADDQAYRDQDEISDCWTADPIERMREYLKDNNIMTEEKINEVEAAAKAEIEEAIEYARHECTEPPIESLYDDIYADGEVII